MNYKSIFFALLFCTTSPCFAAEAPPESVAAADEAHPVFQPQSLEKLALKTFLNQYYGPNTPPEIFEENLRQFKPQTFPSFFKLSPSLLMCPKLFL